MNKEKDPGMESGYSEIQLDTNANKLTDSNSVKASKVFDLKKKEPKEKIILDSKTQ